MAQDWDPNDDTFDPSIQSVVIGDSSWIGDPSPFVHTGSSRTGYTYVNATAYEGMDPSVQISLMVPLKPGETVPAAGGMLMFGKEQAEAFAKTWAGQIESQDKEKQQRLPIKTSIAQANWALTVAVKEGQRFLQLENTSKDKVDTYRFSFNASKKLLGAIEHSIKKLKSKTE
ncbi:hypothetical protein RMSM_05534 [Rhodopirellula maiorica SM1]|uniref:Uncharacterized protein n=2 Tax=Novipirellula TaxID=2795426 RepID=M5REL8_9BACT|nr:hypothetical protein RMSM_05534 [Rhodopirellula maiorica SM1]